MDDMKKQGTNKMNLTFLLARVSSEAASSSSRRNWSSPETSDKVAAHAFPCSPVSSKGLTPDSAKTNSPMHYRLKSFDEHLDPQLCEMGKDADERRHQHLESAFKTERRQRTGPTRPNHDSEEDCKDLSRASVVLPRHSQRAMTSEGQLARAKDSPGLIVPSKSHRCFCGRVFNKREHLKRHDLLVHKDIRPFSCEDCSLRFGTKQNYQVHLTTNKHRQRMHFNMSRNIAGGPV